MLDRYARISLTNGGYYISQNNLVAPYREGKSMNTTSSGRPEIGVNIVGGFKRIVIRLTLYNFAGLKGEDGQDFADFYCSELRDYMNHLLDKTLPDESLNRREQKELRHVVCPASLHVYRTDGGIDIAMTNVANEDNVGHFRQWMSHVRRCFINIVDEFDCILATRRDIPLIQVRKEQA